MPYNQQVDEGEAKANEAAGEKESAEGLGERPMTREGYCCGCNGRIWFWQRTGFNAYWHKRCTEVWEAGYQTAKKFAELENALAGYPTPWQIYAQRNTVNHLDQYREWS